MGEPSRRVDSIAAPGVLALAGGFFAWTALPGPHWHDTAEFAAVARRLSLSHSPGHPLHTLTTHLAQSLPFGDAGLRANLASGFAAAAALALLYGVLRRVRPNAPWWGAALAALIPAVMPAVWLQAARAEVYALQLLLTVALAALCRGVARGEPRALPALAFTFGLAGANHSLLGLAMIPPALWAMAVGARRMPFGRALAAAVPAGALGLSTYVYLPLRATAGGEIGWGRPDDLLAFLNMITARDWMRMAPDQDTVDLGLNFARLVVYQVEQLGVGAAVLGLLVVAGLLLGRGPALRTVAPAAAVVLLYFGTKFFYTFDPLNPDLGGYFAAALVAGVAVAWAAAGAGGRLEGAPAVVTSLAFGLTLALAAPGFDAHGRRDARVAEQLGRALLAEAPPEGALVYSDYSSNFVGWYLRAVEGARPDLALVFRGQVGRPWQQARLATQAPGYAAALPGFPTGFQGPEVRYEPGVVGARLGAVRDRLRPVGTTFEVGADWPRPEAVTVRFPRFPARVDLDSRRGLAFVHAQHAAQLLRHPDRPEARALAAWHLRRAEARAPGDPLLRRLADRLVRSLDADAEQ